MTFNKVGSILKNRKQNVNNVNKDIINNVNNVKDLSKEDFMVLFMRKFNDDQAASGWLVDKLMGELGDREDNRGFYKKIVKENTPQFLLECLAIVKDAVNDPNIKIRSKPAYFVGVFKKRCGINK